MIDKFWEKFGEGLAGEWNARTIGPAFAFWGGIMLAWAYQNGWDEVQQFLKTVDVITGAALLIAGVFLLAISAGFVQWLTVPVLRFFEGYWPRWLWGLRKRLTDRINRKVAEKDIEWNTLADKFKNNTLTPEESERYIRLDSELDNYPVNNNNRMPTIVGNTLRAAEEHPNRSYGLEISTTWPRFWLCLPDNTQKELNESRQSLNWSTQLLIWGILYVIGVYWDWWAIVVSLVVILFAYLRIKSTADVYSQLLRSAYDLNRFKLYEALRWELPANPDVEKEFGTGLTVYLKRNIPPAGLPPDQHKILFDHPMPGDK